MGFRSEIDGMCSFRQFQTILNFCGSIPLRQTNRIVEDEYRVDPATIHRFWGSRTIRSRSGGSAHPPRARHPCLRRILAHFPVRGSPGIRPPRPHISQGADAAGDFLSRDLELRAEFQEAPETGSIRRHTQFRENPLSGRFPGG